jgi:hypothetical protein
MEKGKTQFTKYPKYLTFKVLEDGTKTPTENNYQEIMKYFEDN